MSDTWRMIRKTKAARLKMLPVQVYKCCRKRLRLRNELMYGV